MGATRSERAATNAVRARGELGRCRLCAHRCGADRRHRPAGLCHAGPAARLFHQGIEWAGEAAFVPTAVLSLSGCNFRCAFCLTGGPSQDAGAGEPLDAARVANSIAGLSPWLRSVTVLGGEPSIHLPSAFDLIARLPASLSVVWKTNAYASLEAMALLDGTVGAVLADFKFGNDACALRLAAAPHYLASVRDNLRWAASQSRLVVRHLVMPGHFDCCTLPVLDELSRTHGDVPLSLMGGYLPAYHAALHPELVRLNRPAEVDKARVEALRRGLRLAPWTTVPVRHSVPTVSDELWVDRHGRILVDSASSSLLDCLEPAGLAGGGEGRRA